MATDRQIAFITTLAAQAGHASNVDAINAYGLGLRTARDLTVGEASEMIDWLTGKPHRASVAAPIAVKVVKTGPNKGGRVGATVVTKAGTRATVVSDNGKKVRVSFADGSLASYDVAILTFTA